MGKKKKEIYVPELPEPWKAYYSDKRKRLESFFLFLWINLFKKIDENNNVKDVLIRVKQINVITGKDLLEFA